mmetsp:Transcript_20485/g.61076  ORF Transcript_20485/g.61076 Transcript_20485/m.61076 type:complete len:321 (-) Transcript_20485:310-1272(-)|eukprot:CAMPEP_0119268364 /NCGR_PEP_ID=MMETSP1329-20130426/6165_1 /TAXON_ID=114041 /ORGANISM="Genus nov. species nov., Strain RCC1024" /LENGTH=320 /DNA_ID=CAMNT_0007268331 /DNA_START=100 /DNA_END=1062 /DNA_ORIENTATION=-
MGLSRERKQEYFGKMEGLLDTYSKIFIVSCDNVGSKQFQQIRIALRGEATVLMGKNTMMRKVVTAYLAKNPGHPYEMLLPKIMGNIGFVFTNGDLCKVRELIEDNRVPAPARVGAIAPVDVIVPPGPTDCDPGQTNFFQTLQIATKIVKGRIEITSPVNLLKVGDKVGNSEAVLLQKLHINPFDYGLVILDVYDNGSMFDVKVLDLTDEDLVLKFSKALQTLASICLEIGYPTTASTSHSIANAFKSLIAIAVEGHNFSFAKADLFKAYLADPSAFAVATVSDKGPVAAKDEAEEDVQEEEVDLGGGMDMFGGEEGGGDY